MKKLTIGLLAALVLLSCHNEPKTATATNRYSYPDILNIKGTISVPQQYGVSSFSDLGSWHSFSLIKDDDKKQIGSFVGPYLMRQQQSFWLSSSFIGLQIKDVKDGSVWDLSQAKNVSNIFYPGLLKQSFEVNGIEVDIYLFNVNERSTLITADLINTGPERELQLGWKGHVFADAIKSFDAKNKSVQVSINDAEIAQVLFNSDEISIDDSTYDVHETPVKIGKGNKRTISAVFSYTFNNSELKKYTSINKEAIQDTEALFAKNEERWNGYIQTLMKGSDDALLDINTYDKLGVKALLTLMHNWRSAAGDIFHQGIVPSYAAPYFQGLWAWDSWKHAVAIAPFEGELAKDQIRAMFDYQDEAGMIADCFFRDLSIEGVNWRNSKAPLSGWSIYEVYKQTQDIEFLRELYPKLLKYHEWWYINRDHDKNGLCEYGSTDGSRIAAAWESGMDNAVRFDDAIIVENGEGSYSINQESVDLNAYLVQEKRIIQKIARVLGDVENEEKFGKEASDLTKMIQDVMYCPEDGYYYDVELKSQKKIQVQGPEGWATLYNRVATAEQAKEVVKVIMDSKRFNTPMPFPTLSAAHEKFNPEKGYWRGPVWLDQAYFGIVGMNNYGFETEARQMAQKMVERAKGLAHTQEPIRENYHPLTKEGLNAEHFSWSAAHILMLF